MALNKNYILDTPKYQGTNLPTLDDFGGDVPKYMAALKAAYDADTNNSAPAYAAPGSFTTPDGQQMSSAGYHLDKSAGELAADAYNRIMQRAAMSQVKGPGVGLTAQSRMSVRPDEAALAFNAYKLGESGLPEFQLNPYMANLMEAYGMRSPAKPEQPGVDHPPRFSGRDPRDGNPPRGSGRPPRDGVDTSKLDPVYSYANPPVDTSKLDPIYSTTPGSPAIPGGVSPMPGEYPQIGYNPPSSGNIPGNGSAGAPLPGSEGVPSFLLNMNSQIDPSKFNLSPPANMPPGNGGMGSGSYPQGLLEALKNHRNPTGQVGY